MSPPYLQIQGLRMEFGDVVAVHDVTLDIRQGEFLTFLVSDNATWVAANCARVPSAAWRSEDGVANPMDALSAMFDCGGLRQP